VKTSLRSFSLLLALVCVGVTRAQDSSPLTPRQAAEFWLSTSVVVKPFSKKSGQVYEHKFFKKFRLSGELGYRGNENLFNGKLLYTVLGFRYRFNKHVRLLLENRYNMRGPTGTNSFRNDIQLDLSTKVDRFTLGYRFTAQHEYIDVAQFRDLLRNRVEVSYNVRKLPLEPYLAAESFTALRYDGNRLIGMRYTVGTQIALSKGRSLDLGVRHDREINLYDPLYRWIFAASFDMNLN
jgi:hypothetical protein